jgi:hypothetical protein
MNGRTDFLIAYTEAIRHKTSCFEKTQKLRLQLSGKEIEYNEAKRVELQAEQAVEEAKKMFEQSKLSLTREMIRFERERARDIRKALRDYASQQLESGRQRVEILQSIHFPTKEL